MIREKFLDYLRSERKMSPATVESYGRDLEAFEVFFKALDNQIAWESVDSDIIRDWLESMMDKGNAATSVNRRLSALRSLYRFALSRKLVARDPSHIVRGPKKKKPLPVFMKESEMDRLIDSGELWNDTYRDLLARTLVVVLYETGVRRSELVGLRLDSIDWTNRHIKVTGKRDKQRLIPFGDEMAETLRGYISQRAGVVKGQTSRLFINEKGAELTGAQAADMVRYALGKVTAMSKRSPHVLRHSFATAMLNNEAGLESVKKLLGHASLNTTEIYTHTTFEQLKREYKNAHPRA